MTRKGYDVWCQACGCIMRIRQGKYGNFYGCTGYPQCRNTLTIRDGALQEIMWEKEEKDHE